MLDIARIESGKLALAPEPVNVRATLESALSLMKPLAAERRIRLAPLGGDLDGAVLCNAQRFKQVLLNLLSNAVKFSREGGYVAISCEKAGDRLRFNIEDHGRGISAENMPRLFVPFERLDPGDAAAKGAGLGLTLSKRLTEAMGGRIGVESVPDQGTVFWVELPLVTGAGRHRGARDRRRDSIAARRRVPPRRAPSSTSRITNPISAWWSASSRAGRK